LAGTDKNQRRVENLKKKRDALVAVLELLLEEGSDPSCRQGSTGPSFEVGVELMPESAGVPL